MSLPSVLFIPERFMDYRLWSDIPDRLRGRALATHYDQHELPWSAANGEFLDTARRLAPDGGFHVVAAAGQAARFAFALAEAGLAKSLVFFQPSLDSIPDDVRSGYSGLGDLGHALDPYLPIVSASHEPDPARRRDILLGVVRDNAGQDLEPAELELLISMYSDHAEEFFAHLQASAAGAEELRAAAAAEADEPIQPSPWWERPWVDRLSELTVPVVTVVSAPGRVIGEAIARRAKDAEIVVAAGRAGLAPAADRARVAEALLHMIDRVS